MKLFTKNRGNIPRSRAQMEKIFDQIVLIIFALTSFSSALQIWVYNQYQI
jgi:hypothetical protein